MSIKKALTAATQLTPVSATVMRYIDEHVAEQQRIKTNRILQVLEFRIDNFRSKMEKMDSEILHIAERIPVALTADSHVGSYLCGLILANAGRSSKDALVDYYINQIASFSPIEAAIVYSISGKIRPDNDSNISKELDKIDGIRLEFNSQFQSLKNSLSVRGIINSDGNELEPLLMPLLSES